MIVLPPGARRVHTYRMVFRKIDEEMATWWLGQGGEAKTVETYDSRGRRKNLYHIRVPGHKWSHQHQDGSERVTLQMLSEHARWALLWIMRWNDEIEYHDVRIEDAEEIL